MSTDTEPPLKRAKTTHQGNNVVTEIIDKYVENVKNSQENLQAVLSDEIYRPIEMIKVFVGHIKDPKNLSKTIQLLNEKIPLKELQHLKRVRKQDVVLCPTHFLNGMSSIQEYIECNVNELNDVFQYFKELEVPYTAPKLKQQFRDANKLWPCNFHPNKYLEKLISGSFFTQDELKLHRTYMEMAFEVTKYYLTKNTVQIEDNLKNVNATIVVDPRVQSIVAVSFDNRQEHPVQHSAMLAIDNVAKTQNGGAWVVDKEKVESVDSILRGIDLELQSYLKKRFSDIKFGARRFKSKRDAVEKEIETEDGGPYLCTGYYIYMVREPCFMCSMGLVHARANRVFFCLENTDNGALKSKTKLQTVTSLNHHFEVFTGFL